MTADMTADMTDMMIRHDALDNAVLRWMILAGEIRYGGNHRLGIYGRLDCASGKRMKRSTRVFFAGEDAARAAGFRPCGLLCWMPIECGVALHLAFARKLRHISCVVP